MHTGYYISGLLHGLLVLWLLFGDVFRPDPPKMDVAEVTIVSEAEFAALTQPATAPEPLTETQTPPQPPEEIAPPETPVPEARPETPVEPPQPSSPSTDSTPEPLQAQPQPLDLIDTAPQPPAPPPAPPVNAPETALRPVPRPAPRVAPEPSPQPDTETTVDPSVREAALPVPEPEAEPAPEQDATAPPDSAPEIVTEAEQPARAPTRSLRPQARPVRQAAAPPPEPADTPEPATPDPAAAAIAGALQEALSAQALGPPLSASEREGFRVAVQQCWVVDVGSQAANVTVTIGFEMDRDARVIGSSLRLLDSSGGSGAAVDSAFQAARRAILRCQGDGYGLPAEKYEQWKTVEMTFNPKSMRIR